MAIQGNQLMIVEWCMITVTFILLVFRLYVRLSRKSTRNLVPGLSDLCIILAWVSFLIEAILDSVLNNIGFLNPDTNMWVPSASRSTGPLVLALKILYVENVLYLNTMYFVKVSMLLLYCEWFPQYMKKTRLAIRITSWIVAISWISELFICAFSCWPVHRNWSLDENYQCSGDLQKISWMVSTIPHIFTDLLVYMLPFPVIIRLELSLRLTIGLILTFAVGLVCMGFASALLVTAFVTTSITTPWIFAVLEQTYALVAACCPSLKACCLGGRDHKLKWRGKEITSNAVIESNYEKSPSGTIVFNRDVTNAAF